jgi:hypothetical protein
MISIRVVKGWESPSTPLGDRPSTLLGDQRRRRRKRNRKRKRKSRCQSSGVCSGERR